MGKPNANRLGLSEQIKIRDWLKDNWELRVIKDKLNAGQVAAIVATEFGIEKVTDGNIRGIMKECFPQWDFLHAANDSGGIKTMWDMSNRLDRIERENQQLQQLVSQLSRELKEAQGHIANMQKELGINALVGFVSKPR